jgi:uncharacterized protein (DUF2252 family)
MKAQGEIEGRLLRKEMKRSAHGTFKLPTKRPSVVSMIKASNKGRIENLVPIRHARMSASPFAFYRGTASIMAYDLSFQQHSSIMVQAIGDCHLMNFGGFATPERTLIFDVNDFDETNIAPFEWDLKRLTTSFILAARNRKFGKNVAFDMAKNVVKYYRQGIQESASMSMLDLWYMKFDLEGIRDNAKTKQAKQYLDILIEKGEKQKIKKVFYKITKNALGKIAIADKTPLIYHPINIEKSRTTLESFLGNYAKTLQPDRRWLFEQYKMVDVALKVVGVGSVGTACYVVLLMNDKHEPLFLQVKEARESVLEPFTHKSIYKHHGQRIVEGQRLVQAASDVFLGWSTGPTGKQFFVRQLKDKKISPEVETFDRVLLGGYAKLCGKMLARAHAKIGVSTLLTGYMGNSEKLDEALAQFAVAYADQTENDYEEFMEAIKSGVIKVAEDLPEES